MIKFLYSIEKIMFTANLANTGSTGPKILSGIEH
jgi:hypothetical protein